MQIIGKSVFRIAAVASFLTLPGTIEGAITFNLDAGILRNADGSAPAPDTTLLVLAASTLDSTFADPTPTAFLSGDDVEIFHWELAPSFGTPGFTGPLPITFDPATIPNLNVGDPLRLYWFPTLQAQSFPSLSASAGPGAGTPYGSYGRGTDIPAAQNGSIEWRIPTDGTVDTLNFHTSDIGGSTIPASAGYADLTVVPEPSAYAAMAGAGCLVFGAAARLFRKKG